MKFIVEKAAYYLQCARERYPKTFWFSLFILILYVATLLIWPFAYPSGTLRYKMTVVVATPEGLTSGSAVREVALSSQPRVFGVGSPGFGFVRDGEAIVIDLGKRGVFFALMAPGWNYGGDIVIYAFPQRDRRFTPENIRYYRELKSGKVSIEKKQYPFFVYFKDLADAKTIKNIKIEEAGSLRKLDIAEQNMNPDREYLTDAFGEGVSIKDVTVEITQEPITHEILNRLPWLKGKKESLIEKKPKEFTPLIEPLYKSLEVNDFIIGNNNVDTE